MPAQVGMLQEETGQQGDRGQPPAHGVQTAGKGEAHLGERTDAQIQPPHRAGGCVRTDEIRHAVQTLPSFWQGQGLYGLCLLRHRLQYQENDPGDEKGGIETRFRLTYGSYTEQFEPIAAHLAVNNGGKRKSAV